MTTHHTPRRHEDLPSIHVTVCELADTLFLLSTSDVVRKASPPVASALSLCAGGAERLAGRLEVLADADETGGAA